MMGVMTAQAGNFNWGEAALKTPGALGTPLAAGNNVLCELFASTSSTAHWTTTGYGSDAYLGQGTLTSAGAMSSLIALTGATAVNNEATTMGTGSSLDVYTVVFYNSNAGVTVTGIGNATAYWISAVQSKSISNIGSSDVTATFLGSTTMSWTTVPEPASIGLFAVGLGVLVASRKLLKKKS